MDTEKGKTCAAQTAADANGTFISQSIANPCCHMVNMDVYKGSQSCVCTFYAGQDLCVHKHYYVSRHQGVGADHHEFIS